MSIEEFAKNYIKIQTPDGLKPFDESQLELCRLIDKAIELHGELKLIKYRRGSKYVIIKK